MTRAWALVFWVLPTALLADALTPTRAIRPMSIIAPEDVVWSDVAATGALSDVGDVVGMEAKVTLYPGRPIRRGDVGPPAIVERNQMVVLTYQSGGVSISTEGRALARGAVGEWVRVMNVSSRTTVSGRVSTDGRVIVSPATSILGD